MPRCAISVSAIWLPIFMVGLSEVIGSWKIMPIAAPRTRLIARAPRPISSCPSRRAEPPVMRPGGMSISPMIACTVTDLPQPDSPTTASVRPRSTA